MDIGFDPSKDARNAVTRGLSVAERYGDMKKRKPNPELIDDEIPEWTAADFKRARPAKEVLPKLIGKAAAEQLLKPRGRPKSPDAKVSISLRVPPDILARWKASGPGWQSRMVERLAEAAPRRRRKSTVARNR